MSIFIQQGFVPGQVRQPQIRVESNLVLVDLIVTREGRFLGGLKRDDVEILEEGERREISFFQLIGHQGTDPSPSVDEPRKGFLREPARPGPLIFLVDLNSIDGPGLSAVRDAVADYLRTPQVANRRYLLATVGDEFSLQGGFSSDRGPILEALDQLSAPKPRNDYQTLIGKVSGIFRTLYPRLAVQAMEDSIREAKWFLIELRSRIKNLGASMRDFAHWFAALPGRKTVVFYSAGYPMNSGPVVYDIMTAYNEISPGKRILPAHLLSARLEYGLGDNQLDEVRAMIRNLNSAQVSVYSIDVRGLSSQMLLSSKDVGVIPQRLLARRNSEHITAPQEFLSAVAQGTGGLTFLNRNDLDKGIARAAQDGDAYYLVGYVPKVKPKQDDFVDIEVRVKGNRVDLRYRSGYFAPLEHTGRGVLESAFRFPGFYQDFPLKSQIVTKGQKVAIEIKIPSGALAFDQQGDRFKCTIELFGLVLDESGRPVTWGKKFSFAKRFQLDLNRSELDSLRHRATISAAAETMAPEGNYRVVTVVRQRRGELMSAFTQFGHRPAD